MPNPQGDEAAASICVQDRGSKLLGRPPNSRIVYNSDELDGIYNGVRLTFPTDEEKKSLRRVPDSIPLNVYRELSATNLFRITYAFVPLLRYLSGGARRAFLALWHKRPSGKHYIAVTFCSS